MCFESSVKIVLPIVDYRTLHEVFGKEEDSWAENMQMPMVVAQVRIDLVADSEHFMQIQYAKDAV